MNEMIFGQEIIAEFQRYLLKEEKSEATIEKYIRDVKAFMNYLKDETVTKEEVIAYKQSLLKGGYAIRSINSMLASLNSLFAYLGRADLRVKAMRVQVQVFCSEKKELSRKEYERLCRAAKQMHKEQLYMILQTICSTGIRVSELQFITAEAVRAGSAEVSLKGKIRTILIPNDLRKKLLHYIAKKGIRTGMIFVTRSGKALSRTTIWREMKNLCEAADVAPDKVFPHNLRHLFARIFYSIEKDIVKLSDLLGHSSVETTRIYIISTGSEHRHCMERMRLVI